MVRYFSNLHVTSVLIEAMAMRNPVATTHVRRNPEIIKDGVNSLSAKPGDHAGMAKCVMELLCDRELTREFGNAGGKRVEKLLPLNKTQKRQRIFINHYRVINRKITTSFQ